MSGRRASLYANTTAFFKKSSNEPTQPALGGVESDSPILKFCPSPPATKTTTTPTTLTKPRRSASVSTSSTPPRKAASSPSLASREHPTLGTPKHSQAVANAEKDSPHLPRLHSDKTASRPSIAPRPGLKGFHYISTRTVPGSIKEDTSGERAGRPSMTLGHAGHVHDVVPSPRSNFQLLQDTSAKRIATLDYLRRAHEGTVYWLNTVHFTRASLQKLPYFAAAKLARRANNHLILGLSLPAMLDPYVHSAPDYLRTLNDLLAEFDAYQALHSPDGPTSNSLGRRGMHTLFKRPGLPMAKPRRAASGAAEALSPTRSTEHVEGSHRSFSMTSAAPPSTASASASVSSFTNTLTSFPGSSTLSFSKDPSTTSFPAPTSTTTASSITPNTSFALSSTSFTDSPDLHPSESYTYLLTPSLPFDPDYFETFAALAEVLLDVYLVIRRLVPNEAACSSGVAAAFASADKRIRKVVVEGLVREMGEGAKGEARGEMAGVGRVVLGGLL